jgi:hypothetical protein
MVSTLVQSPGYVAPKGRTRQVVKMAFLCCRRYSGLKLLRVKCIEKRNGNPTPNLSLQQTASKRRLPSPNPPPAPDRPAVARGSAQHSITLTASPPRAVSLYLVFMSAPVSRMVLITWSSDT